MINITFLIQLSNAKIAIYKHWLNIHFFCISLVNYINEFFK